MKVLPLTHAEKQVLGEISDTPWQVMSDATWCVRLILLNRSLEGWGILPGCPCWGHTCCTYAHPQHL